MRDTTMSYDPWEAAPPTAQRESRTDRKGSHVRQLLVIAAVLLAFGLALEDRVVGWALGRPSDRMSANEARHLEEVRTLLQLQHELRADQAAGRQN